MRETLDGCAEFDERLIEHAFSPSPDAQLDRHLVACARCRAARERYLATADALGAALALVPEPAPAAPARSRFRLRLLIAAGAIAAVALAIVWLRSGPERGASAPLRVSEGTSQFTVDRDPLVVETPLGIARCTSGSFTLSVAREGGELSMDRRQAALVVTISVTAGAVWWAAAGQEEVRVDSGSSWIEREPSANVRPAPDLAALEPGAEALPPERRAPLVAEPAPAPELAASTEAAPAAEPKFAIRGRVVDAETGEALRGAVVVLGVRRPDRKFFAATGGSGAGGRFEAESIALSHGLPIRPGVHTDAVFVGTYLAVQAEGYCPRYEVPWSRHEAGSALDAKAPIDLGEIRLYRGAAIAGSVLDDAGAPVAGATLLLAEDTPGAPSFTLATAEEVGRSDENGRFSLARRVPPPGKAARTHLYALDARGIGWAELEVLEAKREIDGVEIRIEPPARLEVLVQDAAGRPVEGAEVRLEPHFEPLVTARYGMRHDHAMFYGARPNLRDLFIAPSDARGRARFERLPATESGGSYDVVALAKGYARDWKDDVLVLPGRDTNAVVVLEAYRARSVSGIVRSAEGPPVADAKVETHSEGRFVAAASDAGGAYRLSGLDPSIEAGWFVVTAPGFVGIRRSIPFADRGDVAALDFVLERPRAIAGRVVDQDGRPIAGAKPSLARKDDWRNFAGEQGRTGDDGRFRFDDAVAGTWGLHVQAPEPLTDWKSPYVILDVEGGHESIEVVFDRAVHEGARVVAEIVDAASGEPLDPAVAQMWPQGAWREDARRTLPPVALGSGRVTCQPVDPGKWRLWVRVAGRATAFADFTVEPGQREAQVRVPVGTAATLAGRVLFDERCPARELTIEAQVGTAGVAPSGPGWSEADASVTRAELHVGMDGEFRLERATPGTWLLTLRRAGLLGHETVEVPSGGEGRVEVRPIAGALLRFRANDAAPKGGMRAELRIEEGGSGNDTYARFVEVPEGEIFEHEATLWSGDVRWKLAFRATDDPAWKPSDGLALPQSGSLRLEPGDVERIRVPIVLRD